MNVIVPCAYVSGIVVFAWIAVQNLGGLYTAATIYAFFSSGLMAPPPPILVALSPSLNQVDVRVGMALTVGSLGVLIGSPIAGAILADQSDSSRTGQVGALNFTGSLVFTGVALLICGSLMTVARISKEGFQLRTI